MKKILALAVLAGALSSCVITIEGGVTPPTISSASIAISDINGNSQLGTDPNDASYIGWFCKAKHNKIEVSFSWTGTLNEYAVKLNGKNGVNNFRDPSTSGFNAASGANFSNTTGKWIYSFIPTDTYPSKTPISTQAVVVTPPDSFTVQIEYRQSGGAVKTFNIPGTIRAYSAGSTNCP